MIKINLLPEERRKKELPIEKIYLVATYAFVILALCLWGYNLAVFKYTEAKLETVNSNISALHVWQERYELNQAQNADIKQREVIVTDLSKTRMFWSRNLAELGNITPYGCWLTAVRQDTNKPEKITITGKALKMEMLLDFIYRLQQEPYINSVELTSTDLNTGGQKGQTDNLNFSVTVLQAGLATKSVPSPSGGAK
ncbi:MAG: PilN domain-containing protein [Acidaminococcaceae bacterium]